MAKDLNCNETCEGVTADIQWVPKKIEEDAGEEGTGDPFELELPGKYEEVFDAVKKKLVDLERELKLTKNKVVDKGEEVDKDKLKELIKEYRKFKAKNVRHISFDSEKSETSYIGKFEREFFCENKIAERHTQVLER